MESALEHLPASVLRNLLIEEAKKFIIGLDHDSTDDLERSKLRLRMIVDLITVKERQESSPIRWGENSTKSGINRPQFNSMSKDISDTNI
jgi:hypothetical protein